jgi:uncharacterized membrane protein YbhN (UPF0104 family)
VAKRLLIGYLKYLVGFGVLVFLVWHYWDRGLSDIYDKYVVRREPVHGGWFLLACLFCLPSVLQTFGRWYILVRAQDLPFTLGNAFRLGLIGYALNTLLPGSVGGDIVKATFIAWKQKRRTVAVATVVMDRVIGLWALVWLVALLGASFWAADLLTGPEQNRLEAIAISAATIVAASMVIWFLLGLLPHHRADRFAGRLEHLGKIGPVASEAWRAVWMYRLKGKSVWIAMGLGVLGHVGFVLSYYCSARTLFDAGAVPSLREHYLIVPIGMATNALIPLPGGIGVGDAAFGALYSWIGYPFINGMFMSLVYRVITWLLGLAGYILYLRMRPGLHLEGEQATTSEAETGLSSAPGIEGLT